MALKINSINLRYVLHAEASPLFAKSGMIATRMPRMPRIRTDFDSPSARPFPPQSVFIRGIRGIRIAIMPLWLN